MSMYIFISIALINLNSDFSGNTIQYMLDKKEANTVQIIVRASLSRIQAAPYNKSIMQHYYEMLEVGSSRIVW